MQSTKVL